MMLQSGVTNSVTADFCNILKLQSYTTVTPFVTPEKPHYIRVFRRFVTKLH